MQTVIAPQDAARTDLDDKRAREIAGLFAGFALRMAGVETKGSRPARAIRSKEE
jgi:hypothetical protein